MNEKEDTLHFYCTKSLHTKELAKLRSGQDQRKMAEQSQAFLCIEDRDYIQNANMISLLPARSG